MDLESFSQIVPKHYEVQPFTRISKRYFYQLRNAAMNLKICSDTSDWSTVMLVEYSESAPTVGVRELVSRDDYERSLTLWHPTLGVYSYPLGWLYERFFFMRIL